MKAAIAHLESLTCITFRQVNATDPVKPILSFKKDAGYVFLRDDEDDEDDDDDDDDDYNDNDNDNDADDDVDDCVVDSDDNVDDAEHNSDGDDIEKKKKNRNEVDIGCNSLWLKPTN